jgi:murein L,D-transpeptidase YafK
MRQIPPFIFFLLSHALFFAPVQASEAIWILIDTTKLSLEVMQGNKTLAVMNDISIGRNGAGFKSHTGDDITPIGSYRIGWVNDKSQFHRFYGFNYPSVENASTALLGGLLSESSYNAIIRAHNKNRLPPQDTALGGLIGIHGLGSADKAIHKMLNWTHGCIALTDKQINRLGQWIGIGTVIKVK